MYPHVGSYHISEHLFWQRRKEIVQRKIDRQKESKSVKHLRHAQLDEMSDAEYKRRIEVLKSWFERGQVAAAQLRRIFEERKKST